MGPKAKYVNDSWIKSIRFHVVGGFNPFEKYELVKRNDDIPNVLENKRHVPNHQPDSDDSGNVVMILVITEGW